MDWRLTTRWESLWSAIRWIDNDVYSKVVWNISYYAFAPMWTWITESKWALIKLFDDWTTMRKSYPLDPACFEDYDKLKGTSAKHDLFDPSDDLTYPEGDLSFSAEYFFTANDLDTKYYSDLLDT